MACVCGVLCAGCAGPAVSRDERPAEVELNQFDFERLAARSGRPAPPRGTTTRDDPPRFVDESFFNDPDAVLLRVLRASPDPAVVYPSEQYYYFKLAAGERWAHGNLRFVDADRDVLHLGYFDPMELRYGHDAVRSKTYSPESGCVVSMTSPGEVQVSFRGVSRRFILDSYSLTARPPFPLGPEESFVSGIRDESGLGFILVYDRARRFFAYYLDPHASHETWTLIPGHDRLAVGTRTRFVVYRSPLEGRILLVGVASRHVQDNTYFDGPFDQVPPRLALRPMLHDAYPYLLQPGREIDEHGNFERLENQRVAITPYRTYEQLAPFAASLEAILTSLEPHAALHALAHDPKRDVPLRSPEPVWPANHEGGPSSLGLPSHHLLIPSTLRVPDSQPSHSSPR